MGSFQVVLYEGGRHFTQCLKAFGILFAEELCAMVHVHE